MYHVLHLFPLLFFLLMLGSQGVVAAAESQTVHTMAQILLKLNHYPSDSEKQTLQKSSTIKPRLPRNVCWRKR